MQAILAYLTIALYAFLLEYSWIASVRFVLDRDRTTLVVCAMAMQFLSYESSRIVVADPTAELFGITGAALGVWFGLGGASGRSDPRS